MKTYLQIGDVYRAQNNLEQAQSSYEKAVAVQPNLKEAYLELGKLYLDEQDYLRAIVTYRKLVELQPTDPEAYFQLGVALQGRGREGEAIRSYQQSRDLYKQQNNAEGEKKAAAAAAALGSNSQTDR